MTDARIVVEDSSAITRDLLTAARLLRAQRTPVASATADLLAWTADDIEAASAHERTAWAGTDMAHQTVWQSFGDFTVRHDWTLALELARTVIRELS